MPTASAAKPSSSSALPDGYRLDEYTIESVLGHGGFGITYKAHDVKLDARVAIKEYFPQAFCARTEKSTIVPRTIADTMMVDNFKWGLNEFLKEARALAKFKHPNIVRVLRFLETNGTAYLVMEYEEGESLSHHLRKRGGFLDEHGLLGIFLPVLTGLQAVHEAGLLHLDIKPDNIYLRTDGRPMLIDFGSSRQMRGNTSQTGAVALTPGYCALEQYPGHGDAGPHTDVYCMGATLYRCITGKQPVDSLQRQQTFDKSRIDPLRPAASIDHPLYAAHIRNAVDQALKLASAERPASAFALQQGLMGKDMSRVEKRGPEVVFRPGSGYIGTILAAPKTEKYRRRLSLFEKSVALLVILATLAIVTPKILIDTGRISDTELYNWIDDKRIAVVTGAQDLGDAINEKVFGKPPVPRNRPVRPVARRAVEQAAPTPVADATPTPVGTNKKPALEIAMPGQALLALGLLKHGTVLVTATSDGLVRLWDAQSGEPRKTVTTMVRTGATLAVFPSSQWFAATDADYAIGIYDPLGNRESVLRNDPPHPITILVVSADDRLLAEAAESGVVNLWDVTANRRLHQFAPGDSVVRALAFSPDGQRLLAGNTRGELIAWETASGKPANRRKLHEHSILALAVAPGGQTVASQAVNGELRLSSMGADSEGKILDQGLAGGSDLVFSTDGKWLLAGGVQGVRVWSTETGELAHELPNDKRAVRSLALSRDGKLIAVGNDLSVRLWR
jgi:serine/threonine protein kinase